MKELWRRIKLCWQLLLTGCLPNQPVDKPKGMWYNGHNLSKPIRRTRRK